MSPGTSTGVHGLLLAAGAGRRMGRPKALVADWLPRSLATLREGGCGAVTVVLGAQADAARGRLPGDPGIALDVVVAGDWASGMGASLVAGLAALDAGATAALVHLVDLPDVGPDVVARVLDAGPRGADALRRAAYAGEPGHPVLLGRDHWPGVVGGASGDRGARDYLQAHPPALVECGDLATGTDVDGPDPDGPGPDQPGANLR